MNQTTSQLTITPLRPLGREESKQDIDMWWTKVKIHLKGTIYKDVMLKTWTAKALGGPAVFGDLACPWEPKGTLQLYGYSRW